MLDSPLSPCIDVDLEGEVALKLDGAIAVVYGGTSWDLRTHTWHSVNAAVRVFKRGLYESGCFASIRYILRKQYSANMTSTTTTVWNAPSETIRLAAAYDDKSHEGVWLK